LKKRFCEHTQAEWIEKLSQFDVTYAPVNAIEEAVNDPQVGALGTMAVALHPLEGEVISVETPLFIDGGRALKQNRAPPVLGEHTGEICAEFGIDPQSVKIQ
jgi:crotonobetainyl-CoA:carnitine CoA-transferase CaiB-like acyl-CoA transferase